MPRKTNAKEPADWLWICEQDLQMLRLITDREVSFHTGRSKLAEVLEKVLKAELIRLGWPLEKTHDLQRLRDALVARSSDLAGVVKPLCDGYHQAVERNGLRRRLYLRGNEISRLGSII